MTAYATPTNPIGNPTGDPTAVVGRRIGAYFIDLILLLVIVFAVMIPAFNDKAHTVSADQYRCAVGEDDAYDRFDSRIPITEGFCLEWGGDDLKVVTGDDFSDLALQFWLIYGAIQVLNLIVLQGITGASIGKHLVGLRVVRADGRNAGIGWCALRTLLLQIDTACCGILGIVLASTTKGHRRLGDMAAGTFVVDKGQVGHPLVIAGLTTPAAQYGPGYTPSYGAPGGWNAGPGDGTGWGTPTPGQPGTPSTWGTPPPTQPGTPGGFGTPPATGGTPASATPAGGDGPTWDAARNAYIQYDHDLAAWMQWDDATREWKPISQ